VDSQPSRVVRWFTRQRPGRAADLIRIEAHRLDGATAAAQDYPNRPVTLIANFPPGGSTDAMARIIREPLSQALGRSIIIDNRGGAGGTTGAAAVVDAKPDGYTRLGR
jgi:tripartite-type tricarboxylate transporter receptor subunit TctC